MFSNSTILNRLTAIDAKWRRAHTNVEAQYTPYDAAAINANSAVCAGGGGAEIAMKRPSRTVDTLLVPTQGLILIVL